jgi:hypothetical protein
MILSNQVMCYKHMLVYSKLLFFVNHGTSAVSQVEIHFILSIYVLL